VRFVWDLAFSPLPSASVLMVLTIAIAVLPRPKMTGPDSLLPSALAEARQPARARPRIDERHPRHAP
jgi:hypothetical protein